MAQKYVTLEEAADRLGMSAERLSELREQGKTHGYRDGTSWKFKAEEIDRLEAEDIAKSEPATEDVDLDLGTESSGGSDSLLLSEVELGDSDASSTSKIIGGSDQQGEAAGGEGSDLELAADSGLDLELPSSSINLDIDSSGSDVQLASPSSDLLSGDEGGSEVLASGPGSQFENLDELDIDLEVESSRIMSGDDVFDAPAPGGPAASAGSELSLDTPDEPTEVAPTGGSEIDLTADDDLVLGEGSGSDITLSSADSGISLLGASDSGLSLDDPDLDLGGSEVESLKLSIDEDVSAEPEAPAPELESGEDFLLTPMAEAPDEESDDSGSQVIALDSEADLDENAVTQLGSMPAVIAAAVEESSAPAMLEEDLSGIEEAVVVPVMAEAPMTMAPAAAAEPAYSGLVIASLMGTVSVLGIVMMMMFDLVRNMWSWNESYTLKSGLMDSILSFLGYK